MDAVKVCALKGCEIEFTPKRSNQLYCTSVHANQSYNDSRYSNLTVERQCAHCGQTFHTKNHRKIYHSPECKKNSDNDARRGEKPLFLQPRQFKTLPIPSLPDGYKVIIVNDLQRPFHDVRVLEAVERCWDDYQPDLEIYNGDVADCYIVSDHIQNPSRAFSFQDEMDDTRKWLYKRAESNPSARRIFIEGNHEDRIRRFLWKQAPALSSLRSLSLSQLLGFDELKMEHLNYNSRVNLLGFLIEHGNRVSGGGVYTNAVAPLMARDRGSSGLMGHTHRLASFHFTTSNGSHTYYENGCLCIDQLEYKAFPNWQHGFALGIVFNNKLHITQITIYPDGFYALGQFYPIRRGR